MKKVIYALAVMTLMACSHSSQDEKKAQHIIDSIGAVIAAQVEADSIEQTNNWTYEETVDEMEGTKSKFASTSSTNTLQFAFPYDGGSTGDLVVRKMGKKLDVYLKISKGQFISSYTWDRTVDIKFDEGKTMQYAYGSSSDYSSDVIFLDNPAQLLSKLKAAKQVKIKIDFYQYSGQVLTFNTEGLNFK